MKNFLKAWAVSLLVDAVFYGVLWLANAPEKVVVGCMVGAFVLGSVHSAVYAMTIYCDNRSNRW